MRLLTGPLVSSRRDGGRRWLTPTAAQRNAAAPAASHAPQRDGIAARMVPYVAVAGLGMYLSRFVDRGWVAHDEGHLGHAAERVLQGQLPHVDFDETYTAGLTWLYAAIFGTFGVELLWLRWALFAGAMLAVVCFYRLFRRFAGPAGAAVGCTLATVWAFPNYFAPLPSWWNMILAAAALLALFRFAESGRDRELLLAGLLTGLSLAVKQTALYVAAGSVLTLLYIEQARCPPARAPVAARPAFLFRAAVALVALTFVLVLLRERLSASTVLVFVAPVAGVCAVLVADARRRELPRVAATLRRLGLLAAGVSLPMLLILSPYVVRGATAEFLHGWLIAPQARTTYAAMELQSPLLLLLGVPLAAWPLVYAWSGPAVGRWVWRAGWIAALLLPLLVYVSDLAYQVVWQSVRLAGVVPLLAAVVLWVGGREPVRRARIYAAAAVMAFWSLVQYPFSAPLYLCYVVPFAPVVIVALAEGRGRRWMRPLLPLAVLYLGFAVLSLNRGDLGKVGVRHEPVGRLTPLGVPRANLRVPEAEAAQYRRVVELVERHRRTPEIYAAPDCPEVYFLSASRNPTRTIYDVLGSEDPGAMQRILRPDRVSVIVLNHAPHFSPPPDEAFVATVRGRYPVSERVGRFEVFWTDAPR